MKKFKDYNIFGHDRPILKFWIMMICIMAGALLGRYIICLIYKDNFNWSNYTFFLFLCTMIIISYFVGRLIAYKTKLFPQAQNRDNVLKWTFTILGLSLITLSIFIIP
ncbi:MAG: hypothetical protein K6A94_06050 [Bacteroidales bacterium]|nr:hypothetical protein [Bacteroidales bacterium]